MRPDEKKLLPEEIQSTIRYIGIDGQHRAKCLIELKYPNYQVPCKVYNADINEMTVEKLSFSVNTVATATVSDSLYTMCQRVKNASQTLIKKSGDVPTHPEVSDFLAQRGLNILPGQTGHYQKVLMFLGEYGWDRLRFENDSVPPTKRVLSLNALYQAASATENFWSKLGSGLPASDLGQLKHNSYQSFLAMCYPEPDPTLFTTAKVPIVKGIKKKDVMTGATVCAQGELLRYLAFEQWYLYMSH